MYKTSMALDVEYLLSYLEDELRGIPRLRIHTVAPTGTKQAADLPQNYDPSSSDAHLKRGVRVRADSREFFFPAAWVHGQMDQIQKQATEIKDYCAANF